MKSLAEALFDIGFFPIIHESVKQDFLTWYYEGSKANFVKENLDIEISELSKSAQKAGTDAEKFDETHQLSQMVAIFEEWTERAKIVLYYIAGFAFIFGGGIAAAGVLQIKTAITSAIFQVIGGVLLIGSVGTVIVYHILLHQIKTNTELIAKFNGELVERSGDIRDNDRDWNLIASKFFWNRSLLSPSTHICLIILSIIRVISIRMYGKISADLREEVKEFVGMNSKEIIRRQIRRAVEGDLPSRPKNRR